MGQCFSDASLSEFSCDPKKYLPENLLEKVLIHRESAFNICLNCNGDECAFRDQLLNDEKSLNLCKRLFFVLLLQVEDLKYLLTHREGSVHSSTITPFPRKVMLRALI